ncbi:MarR family transcriptional regulator [Bacillus cereus]|uniref:MarR family winged helix-turn-helix transcriptional regulator n=1 Tax=Bacillus cereus TaxID=1396 RepID=UPI00187B0E8E|nr:MarR family transcriptional regulator [Bacillus cereus]MBE7103407.1 MarR family transcriptional regulator [Bacillus cereus]
MASQDEIASILKVDKGTVARAIAKLETEGYVERKVFTAAKRIKKLYLTDKAHTFEKKLIEVLVNWKNILVEDLSDDEQEYVVKLFKKMTENAEVSLDKLK